VPDPVVDGKLFALARSARARIEAAEGAAVVDETGRTYSAANVNLPHLRLSAVAAVVAVAAGAGARALSACVVVGDADGISSADVQVAADLECSSVVLRRPGGEVVARWEAP